MAVDTSGGHPVMDYAEHTRTYRRFVRFTIIAVIAHVILLLGMLKFLVP